MKMTTETVPDREPNAEERMMSMETMEAITALVMELPDAERVVIECRYLHGITQTEVAAFLGLSERQVRRREVRAIRRMREALNEEV